MKSRSRSVLAKLVTLLALPLISLVVLWAIAASLTLSNGIARLEASERSNEIGFPIAVLLAALQSERQFSVADVGSGRRNDPELAAARNRTDAALADVKQTTSNSRFADEVRTELDALVSAADDLAEQRSWINTGATARLKVADYYSGLIRRIFATSYALRAVPEPGRGHRADGLLGIGEATEVLSQEAAIVSGALAAGHFEPDEYDRMIGLINTRRFLLANARQKFPEYDQQALSAIEDTPTARTFLAMEDSLIKDGSRNSRPPVDQAGWNQSTAALTGLNSQFSRDAAERFTDSLRPGAYRTLALIVVAGLLGLISVVVSIVVSVRIGRSLVGELVGVQRSAQSLATYELPAVVRRLRAGESVDLGTEVQPMAGFTVKEIEGVASAMDAARSTAVEVAIEEAELRRGVREVFLNLARRSQALIHRQLTLLDAMERREKDPDELEDLFTLDHLATRMRRHAEDLIVLSGSTPGRGWRNPVPMIDVMRGAIAEVEDYARVRVVTSPQASLAGRGVSDVIHLLAELVENATSFSPPHTTVHVTGELVPAGFAIEIEDRGLGMPADQLTAVNARLAEPPEFDLLHSERLGLFVVAQLARRHDIRVVLRGSPFGGTTAIVLLPSSMIVAPESAAPQRWPGAIGVGTVEGTAAEAKVAPPMLTVAPDLPTDRPGAGRPDVAVEALGMLDDAAANNVAAANGAVCPDPAEPPPVFDPTAWSGGADWSASTAPASGSTAPASGSDAPATTNTDGLPPLIRRDPGAGWEQLTSHGPLPRRDRARPDDEPPAAPNTATPDSTLTAAPMSLGDRLRAGLAGQIEPAEPTRGGPVRGPEPTAAVATPGGLPRRVRQASLAAPLRAGSGIPQAPVEPTTMRSPEEIRAVMGSYQRGSILGRSDAARTIGPDSPTDDEPGSGSGRDDSTSDVPSRPDGVPAGRGSHTGALEGER